MLSFSTEPMLGLARSVGTVSVTVLYCVDAVGNSVGFIQLSHSGVSDSVGSVSSCADSVKLSSQRYVCVRTDQHSGHFNSSGYKDWFAYICTARM